MRWTFGQDDMMPEIVVSADTSGGDSGTEPATVTVQASKLPLLPTWLIFAVLGAWLLQSGALKLPGR